MPAFQSQLSLAIAATRNALVAVGTEELRTSTSATRPDFTPLGSYQPRASSSSDDSNLFRPYSVPNRTLPGLDESDEEDYANAPQEVPDGDELPAYSPRTTRAAHVMPQRKHVYSSRSQKLRLEITAAGDSHIVLVEGEGPEGRTRVNGSQFDRAQACSLVNRNNTDNLRTQYSSSTYRRRKRSLMLKSGCDR